MAKEHRIPLLKISKDFIRDVYLFLLFLPRMLSKNKRFFYHEAHACPEPVECDGVCGPKIRVNQRQGTI